jgi:hypothetical protein
MKQLWRRARAALGMGLLWGAAGALGGGLIELILNILPGSDLFLGVDIWPAALAIPGFLAGVLFSVILLITERRRRFDELSIPRISVWGAITGALLGVVVGLPLIVVVPMTLISGASAATSLALARMGTKRESIASGTDSKT